MTETTPLFVVSETTADLVRTRSFLRAVQIGTLATLWLLVLCGWALHSPVLTYLALVPFALSVATSVLLFVVARRIRAVQR